MCNDFKINFVFFTSRPAIKKSEWSVSNFVGVFKQSLSVTSDFWKLLTLKHKIQNHSHFHMHNFKYCDLCI